MTSDRAAYGVPGRGLDRRAIVTGLCDGVRTRRPCALAARRGGLGRAGRPVTRPSRSPPTTRRWSTASDVVVVCLRERRRPAARRADLAAGPGRRQRVGRRSGCRGCSSWWRRPPGRAGPCRCRRSRTGPGSPRCTHRSPRPGRCSTGSAARSRSRTSSAYEALSATSATLAGFFEYLPTQSDWLEARGHRDRRRPPLRRGDVRRRAHLAAGGRRAGLRRAVGGVRHPGRRQRAGGPRAARGRGVRHARAALDGALRRLAT